MKNFFLKLGKKLARMMYGRYGNDALNHVIMVACLILLVLSWIPYLWICLPISLALMVWSTFRTYSKNISARQKELFAFIRFRDRLKGKWTLSQKKWKERKTHCYFKCPQCKAVLRVPRGKGKIDVTCPRCNRITVKKS